MTADQGALSKTTDKLDLDQLGDAMRAVEVNAHFDIVIDARQRRCLVPYSDMHVYRLERDGRFPKRVQLGVNRVGWSLREVLDWIAVRKAARNAA